MNNLAWSVGLIGCWDFRRWNIGMKLQKKEVFFRHHNFGSLTLNNQGLSPISACLSILLDHLSNSLARDSAADIFIFGASSPRPLVTIKQKKRTSRRRRWQQESVRRFRQQQQQLNQLGPHRLEHYVIKHCGIYIFNNFKVEFCKFIPICFTWGIFIWLQNCFFWGVKTWVNIAALDSDCIVNSCYRR